MLRLERNWKGNEAVNEENWHSTVRKEQDATKVIELVLVTTRSVGDRDTVTKKKKKRWVAW